LFYILILLFSIIFYYVFKIYSVMDDNFENLKLSSEFLELISILEWSSPSERFYLDEK